MQTEDIIRLKKQTTMKETQQTADNEQHAPLKELYANLKHATLLVSSNLLSCLKSLIKKT